MKHAAKKVRKKKSGLAVATLILWVLIVIAAVYLAVQAFKYVGGVVSILSLVLLAVVAALLFLCRCKAPRAALVAEILVCILLAVAVFFVGKVVGVLSDIQNGMEYETVQIAVLKDSEIQSSDDLSSYVLGYDNGDSKVYDRSSEILEENGKTVMESRPCDGTEALWQDLQNGDVQMIALTPTTRSDLSMIDEDYETKIRILFEKEYVLNDLKPKAVDITKEPFTIYFCGADLSSGDSITSTGRGDVNILLTINPKTEQVYMQVIPRDTFVYIPCRGGHSKLSYSGWWGGVQSSIESIEDKFGVEINYYAKINFNGLVDLVDALGGVTVYSHYTYSVDGYNFVEGENEVNGEKALYFARARKMLPQNELSRGQHQMELIKGIFRKFAQNPTYDSGMAILDAMSTNFVTNMPKEDYYKVFRLVVKLLPQLQNMENHSIEGEYQWHYDEIREGYYQYYYYPAEGEVERVRDSINAVLEGK